MENKDYRLDQYSAVDLEEREYVSLCEKNKRDVRVKDGSICVDLH